MMAGGDFVVDLLVACSDSMVVGGDSMVAGVYCISG